MNQREFLAFINPLKDRIFRLSLRYLVSKDAAEDATQEVIIKLWNNRKRLKKYDSPEAFAITVTKNHCIDQLKLKGNNNLRIVHSNFEGNESSLQRQIEAKDELKMVSKIISTLTEREQTLIQLRDIEQLEYEEIAEAMDMKETAIRVALSRARKKIRERILKIHRYGTATDK
ncbi:MAG TPA: RNA polymerase sigma factor [Flavobacteriaceae bacterium]|nr:RNA polymerase sigma factor [Flavobacteriaceae bacterium]